MGARDDKEVRSKRLEDDIVLSSTSWNYKCWGKLVETKPNLVNTSPL